STRRGWAPWRRPSARATVEVGPVPGPEEAVMMRWVNVLVLVLVVLLAGGLLAVAVQRVRHADARTRCRNNLKYLGTGLANYPDASGAYPSATITVEGLPPEKWLSWLVSTVPFVDQGGLSIDRKKPWDAAVNIEPRFTSVDGEDEFPVGECKLFRCPSNPTV